MNEFGAVENASVRLSNLYSRNYSRPVMVSFFVAELYTLTRPTYLLSKLTACV